MRKTRAVRKHGGMRTAAYILFAALAGCSSSAKDNTNTYAPPAGCQPQVGAYKSHFAERMGGTCGPLMDQIIGANTSGTTGGVPAGCTGSDDLTSDKCTETIELSCALASGGKQVTGGAIHYSTDGYQGTGVLQIDVFDIGGKAVCSSIYDVTITRQ